MAGDGGGGGRGRGEMNALVVVVVNGCYVVVRTKAYLAFPIA